MKKAYKNKMAESETTKEESQEGRKYFYPEHGVTIRANSKAEADAQLLKKIK
jgi:hypothetical protein